MQANFDRISWTGQDLLLEWCLAQTRAFQARRNQKVCHGRVVEQNSAVTRSCPAPTLGMSLPDSAYVGL